MSDLVGNPEDRVSRDAAHIISWGTDGNKCQNNQIIRFSVKHLVVRKRARFGNAYIGKTITQKQTLIGIQQKRQVRFNRGFTVKQTSLIIQELFFLCCELSHLTNDVGRGKIAVYMY